MYVRLLIGRYAGEERDIRADAARVMLADGRAVLPEVFDSVVLPAVMDVERRFLEGYGSKPPVGLISKRKKA